MIEEQQRQSWAAEFESLGAASVRSQMVLAHWPAEKRSYARQWLEREDVREWQKRGPKGQALSGLRSHKRIWGILAGLVFGGFALFRILRTLKLGI